MTTRLRLKPAGGGPCTIALGDAPTLGDLRRVSRAQLAPLVPAGHDLTFRFGFPPSCISLAEPDQRTLFALGLHSGEVVNVEWLPVEPPAPPAPSPASPAPPLPMQAAAEPAVALPSPAAPIGGSSTAAAVSFEKGEQCEYRDKDGQWLPARVVEVGYDDELVAFFQVELSGTGREKSTVLERLRKLGPQAAVAAEAAAVVSARDVEQLTAMGFAEAQARAALLQTKGNFEEALELCLSGAAAVNGHPSTPSPSTGRNAIGTAAEGEGANMVRRAVAADNSCLFTALAFIFTGQRDSTYAWQLRRVATERILAQPAVFTPAVLGGQTPQAYCEHMLRPSTWGGAVELAVLSEHFETELRATDIQTLNVQRYGECKGYQHAAYLLFDGAHYDPVTLAPFRGAPETLDRRLFAATDTTAEARSVALARSLQSERQFVNLRSGFMRCAVCAWVGCGQEQSIGHATQTGHTNFSSGNLWCRRCNVWIAAEAERAAHRNHEMDFRDA